jgi:hypothetical protein
MIYTPEPGVCRFGARKNWPQAEVFLSGGLLRESTGWGNGLTGAGKLRGLPQSSRPCRGCFPHRKQVFPEPFLLIIM